MVHRTSIRRATWNSGCLCGRVHPLLSEIDIAQPNSARMQGSQGHFCWRVPQPVALPHCSDGTAGTPSSAMCVDESPDSDKAPVFLLAHITFVRLCTVSCPQSLPRCSRPTTVALGMALLQLRLAFLASWCVLPSAKLVLLVLTMFTYVQAPIIALYANIDTAVPVYIAGGLVTGAGLLALLLPFEPRGRASI
jgi:hypothetical protein